MGKKKEEKEKKLKREKAEIRFLKGFGITVEEIDCLALPGEDTSG